MTSISSGVAMSLRCDRQQRETQQRKMPHELIRPSGPWMQIPIKSFIEIPYPHIPQEVTFRIRFAAGSGIAFDHGPIRVGAQTLRQTADLRMSKTL